MVAGLASDQSTIPPQATTGQSGTPSEVTTHQKLSSPVPGETPAVSVVPKGVPTPSTLPLPNPDRSASSQAAPLRPTILLVEDDPLLVKMYRTKFLKEGFEILTAEDGEAGLQLALEKKIDCLVLDLMIPKLSGFDLLAKLRQDPKAKDLPVIILSNLAQPEDAQKAAQLGVKEFLLKANLTPSQVVAKVKQHLGR